MKIQDSVHQWCLYTNAKGVPAGCSLEVIKGVLITGDQGFTVTSL